MYFHSRNVAAILMQSKPKVPRCRRCGWPVWFDAGMRRYRNASNGQVHSCPDTPWRDAPDLQQCACGTHVMVMANGAILEWQHGNREHRCALPWRPKAASYKARRETPPKSPSVAAQVAAQTVRAQLVRPASGTLRDAPAHRTIPRRAYL